LARGDGVVDALAAAATPLVYRAIIDRGIAERRTGLADETLAA
jgi:hypothetical protein